MVFAAALSGIALGFTPPQPVCDANLVFVGTVVELTAFWLPSAAGGPPQLATRVSLTVDHVVRDTAGDTADGKAELAILGGTLGSQRVVVGEMPNPAVGDTWSFVARRYPDLEHPLLRAWSYVPAGTLRSEATLLEEWAATCGG